MLQESNLLRTSDAKMHLTLIMHPTLIGMRRCALGSAYCAGAPLCEDKRPTLLEASSTPPDMIGGCLACCKTPLFLRGAPKRIGAFGAPLSEGKKVRKKEKGQIYRFV